jgi:hypothetical protein
MSALVTFGSVTTNDLAIEPVGMGLAGREFTKAPVGMITAMRAGTALARIGTLVDTRRSCGGDFGEFHPRSASF